MQHNGDLHINHDILLSGHGDMILDIHDCNDLLVQMKHTFVSKTVCFTTLNHGKICNYIVHHRYKFKVLVLFV